MLPEDEVRRLEVALRTAIDWDMGVEKTVRLLTIWKQPFPDDFKRWVKKNIRTKSNLLSFHEALSRA